MEAKNQDELPTRPTDLDKTFAELGLHQPPRWGGGRYLLAALGSFAACVAVMFVSSGMPAQLVGLTLSFASAYFAFKGSLHPHLALKLVNCLVFVLSALTTLMMAAFAGGGGFTRGRQLRRFGKAMLPVLDGRDDGWTHVKLAPVVDDATRRGLAAQWRENGRTEHASVAAFARLTLDLMALGAPPDLVSAANRDALDEIRHAELCFSLARALDGQTLRPSAFPEAQTARMLPSQRLLALSKLAVDSLIDGALYEGFSARVVAKLSRRCEDQEIQGILRQIAEDEWRHAAHGWDVVYWCVAEGGDPVLAALRGALKTLPDAVRSTLPEAAARGDWERWGIHGHALETEEFTRTRHELVRRVESMHKPRAKAA